MPNAFLQPHLLHDVFVSYAHHDVDGTDSSPLRTWSHRFIKRLEDEVRSIPDFRDVSIFLDQGPRPGDRADPTIHYDEQFKRAAQSSGLLAALMSPHYVESRHCAEERTWWLSSERPELRRVTGRAIAIRIWPVPDKRWPREFLDDGGSPLPGLCFHTTNIGQPLADRPLFWPELSNPDQAFCDRLTDLATLVVVKLRAIRDAIDEQSKVEDNANRLAAAGQWLYLHARADDQAEFRRLSDILAQRGFNVVPSDVEPDAAEPAMINRNGDARVKMLIRRCDALLIVAPADPMVLDGEIVTVCCADVETARAESKKPLPCAIVSSRGDGLRTEDRMAFTQRHGIEWFEAAGDGWQDGIDRWLQAKARQAGAR